MYRCLCILFVLFSLPIELYAAASEPVSDTKSDDELTDDGFEESDLQEALGFSQDELHNRFHTGASLDLGLVLPWSKLGATIFWRRGTWINGLSLGFGEFSYSGNLEERNYLVSGNSQATHLESRYFTFGIGPIYIEPQLGLVHWDGEVKPRGNDALADIAASSLTSRFDAMGLDFGMNIGLMWIFKNGIFLDYNFLQVSKAVLFKESYTVNTSDARRAIRRQITGLISMSSLNLRLGYALDF